ncbi:MAG TPA: MBL fold metallo-hydrolase [Bdellovibrionota bacterium]|nr:MBL fold metallo-hydrolase [Bdellovibrionota bacterium]
MSTPVITIDCQYVQPRFAAAYLITEGKRAAFIDNNTTHSVPHLMKALEQAGRRPEDVELIVITHVHLDHAGGTSRLAELCPQAAVLAHPRAAPHVIDPSRLVSSARKVYGEDAFDQLYGEIRPVDASRVRAIDDGETVSLGSRKLTFLHTRGHANHHFCIHDPAGGAIFTGDAFGLRYPDLQRDGLFAFPSTSPTDFIPEEALKSIDRIVATGAAAAYPTHFGALPEVKEAAAQLKEHLEWSAELLERATRSSLAPEELDGFCQGELRAHYETWLAQHGRRFGDDDWRLLNLDLELNGAGIAHVARKRREAK